MSQKPDTLKASQVRAVSCRVHMDHCENLFVPLHPHPLANLWNVHLSLKTKKNGAL